MTSTEHLSQETLSQLKQHALTHGVSPDVLLQRLLQDNPVQPSLHRSIYDKAKEAIVVINENNQYVDVNQAACDLFGYTREEFLTLTAFDLIAEDDTRRDHIKALWDEQGIMQTVYRLRKKDGTVIYVDASAMANVLEDRHVSIMRDVTGQIKLLDDMTSAQVALESIFTGNGTPFFTIDFISDTDFRIQGLPDDVLQSSINQDYQPLSGELSLNGEELQTLDDLLRHFAARTFEKGIALQFEVQMPGEKSQVWLVRLTPVRDARGSIERLFGLYSDLTERHTAEDGQQQIHDLYQKLMQAHELNRYKAEITAMIAHEFQTPLSIISTSAHMIQKSMPENDSSIDRRLERISAQVNRLKHLMYRVIDINYATVIQQELTLTDIHIGDFITDIVSELKDGFVEIAPIEITGEVSDPMITTDAELMRQIITNLLSNAIKYSMANQLPIMVRYTHDNLLYYLTVKDQGMGIPAGDLQRIFEFFERGRNAGQHQGIGIGLMVVKQAVMQLGGTIKINSEEGQGTTVTVHFSKTALQPES